MDEQTIQQFWQDHACGDAQVGGLRERFGSDYEKFFADYDEFRFRTERHLPETIGALNVAGKRVLEIGLGEGADSERLIRCGARWSGVDLTTESVERVRTRLTLRGLPHDELRQGSALELPFPDNSFDVVFSHGVLHHIPDIGTAQREINRVLRPGGELIMMVYARWSLNYLASIAVLRRAALLAAYPLARAGLLKPAPGNSPASESGPAGKTAISSSGSGMLAGHLRNAERLGLLEYLRLKTFTHYNTDGPGNPYALVYDRRRVERDFPTFRVTRYYKRFMHAPPIPVHGLPGEQLLGWHLWVHLEPFKEQPVRERSAGEQPARELPARELPAREQSAGDQPPSGPTASAC